jgi:pSer/pThr/pTyr-binding forkhead associated (FHA) protein
MRRLTVVSGPVAGQSTEIEGALVVGRESADLNTPDPRVSRRHALARPLERGVEVQDLGSVNGTFANGERIDDRVTLVTDAVVRVGDSTFELAVAAERPTRVASAQGHLFKSSQEPRNPTVGHVDRRDDHILTTAAHGQARL